ncbi:hypothetical protein [Kocuria atrinae]|uniref:hypothetical protein n=1 Tax=Kocuria atrinae TaxID=592377 RepID=UPI001CB8E9DE|nr:hypothetical protein [Kocuria atrinae]
MSEPRSEKNKPETPGDPQEPVSSGSANSESTQDEGGNKVAPWTSDIPQVPGPAPMIELDSLWTRGRSSRWARVVWPGSSAKWPLTPRRSRKPNRPTAVKWTKIC